MMNIKMRIFSLLCLSFLSGNVWAIPSPDMVINLTASLAQVLGMASVMVGGLFMSRGKGKGRRANGKGANGTILLGVVAILGVSACLNIWQFTRHSDDRQQQLSANLYRKATENGKAVGGVSLNTLSFSEQVASNRGISTEQLSALYKSRDSSSIQSSEFTIVDVREDEEVESGRIPGARHIRYPDLLKNPDLLKGKENVVLICYSGNRSSELTRGLAERGLETRFMVGGYEKWMAEGKVLDVATGSRDTLRELPDFMNKDTLLETAEATRLVLEEGAVFVDVRYPAEFQSGHLPDAYNLTIRAEPTDTLNQKIQSLPQKTLIGVCYDRRSCFYSQILGLKATRAGYDFAGRFTVPHEYVAPVAASGKQYLDDWKTRNQASLLGLARIKLGKAVSGLVESTGNVLLALFIIVAAIRIPLLPIFLKMERDRLVLVRLAPELKRIKNRFTNDPSARADATSRVHKENNIRPLITLVGSLMNLGLLLILFSVISAESANWTQSVLWFESAADADMSRVLPVVIFGLVLALAMLMNCPLTRLKTSLCVAGAVAIGLLVIPLTVAVNVYLVLSLGVLIVQSFCVSMLDRRYGWSKSISTLSPVKSGDPVIPLGCAHLLPDMTGKKAARLGELIEAGFNVPDGFVITTRFAGDLSVKSANEKEEQQVLDNAWRKIGAKRVAVRSSGVSEDGEDASFAGVYDSVLNVTRIELKSCVLDVYKSLTVGLASAYAQNRAGEFSEAGGGILVQKMVDADYAGVLFTEHPLSAGKMLVEMVDGLGEELVSGTVTPSTYECGRVSFSTGDKSPPIDLKPLLRIASSIEKKFGKPQDIEWAYKDGKYFILQARDITILATSEASARGLIERERKRVLATLSADSSGDAVLVQNELSELLPRPTLLSASFMEKLWAYEGSTHLACERLHISYKVDADSAPYVNTLFGWLYVNKAEEKKRLASGPGALASFKLSRDAEQIADAFEQEFLPAFRHRMITASAVDFDRLSIEQLVETFSIYSESFVTETYVEAEIINICNQFYWNTANTKLRGKGVDPQRALGRLPENVVSKAMNLLARAKDDRDLIGEFIDLYGHRSPTDYELSNPRFCEDNELVDRQIDSLAGHTTEQSEPVQLNDKMLQIAVERVRRFQVLKEEAKHECLREYDLIRRVLLAIDKKCNLNHGIFHLAFDEVLMLNDEQYLEIARNIIEIRQREQVEYQGFTPPSQLSITAIEDFDPMGIEKEAAERPDSISGGTRVAGKTSVSGVVHVIRNEAEIDKFREGEILVARMTDPSWYPLFPLAKGIITEIGGWLSHAAIVAREYDLPATVGVPNATQDLRSGDIVKMHKDGTIERLSNLRAPDSPMRVSVPAAVTARDSAKGVITDPKVVALVRAEQETQELNPPKTDEVPQENTARKSGSGD